VWRAAYGINPKDPRPTGGTQLKTLSALWKERLDRHITLQSDLCPHSDRFVRQREGRLATGSAHRT